MAKRFETTPRGLERTEMSGLLAVRRAPAKTGQEMETSLSLRLIEERNPDLISGFPPARE